MKDKKKQKDINLVLINYCKDFSKFIIDYLEKKNINHLILIDVVKPRSNINFTIDFFNAEQLALGNYPNSNIILDHLRTQQLKENFELESIVLDMLMRGEKPSKIYNSNKSLINDESFDLSLVKNNLSYEERRNIYKKHLKFWLSALRKRKINCFFSLSSPHIVYDFIPFYLCNKNNIPSIFTEQNKYNGFRVPRDSLDCDMKELICKFKALKKEKKKVKLSDLGEKYILKMSQKKMKPIYYNKAQHQKEGFPDIKTEPFVIFLLRILKNATDKKKVKFFIQRRLIQSAFLKSTKYLKNYYESLCVSNVKDKNFIFLPLHYQPESTTSPFGQLFSDQKFFIEEVLDFAKKNNYKLVVKEHPTQKKTGRDLYFYKEFENLKEISFVSSSYDQYELIRNCKAIATITGTAGWEGIFYGKPVLCYGSSFLKHAPGVFDVKQESDHKNIQDFIINYEKPTIDDIKLFFKAVELTSIKAFIVGEFEKIGMQMDENGFKKSVNSFLDYFFDYASV